jgi:hypothetical protein
MKRCLLSALAVGLCLSANVMAQVPSYVPTNGLVGYWPFNGNANDESGNGNNGTLQGNISFETDRFNNLNNAIKFNSTTDIMCTTNSFSNPNSLTISIWVKSLANSEGDFLVSFNNGQCSHNGSWDRVLYLTETQLGCFTYNGFNNYLSTTGSFKDGTWHHFAVTLGVSGRKIYADGQLVIQDNTTTGQDYSGFWRIGGLSPNNVNNSSTSFYDDLLIYNRVLTAEEITALYNGCSGSGISLQPSNSVNTIGTNAQFSVNAVAGSSYQWQSNPLSLGWQNISNNSIYNGSTTNTLTISNTTVSNHNQPFRAIVNVGGCIDTSNVAQIIIGDTCLTTVTDTLIINTILGLPTPNNENTILIYPNPASDHITIDNGNFAAMAGYTIKIENNAGQQVFQSLINQAQFYVDLSTWSGNGLYFVHLIDAQGNTVTVRKIVLQ